VENGYKRAANFTARMAGAICTRSLARATAMMGDLRETRGEAGTARHYD
jgi:hypothetical protein